MIRKVTLLFLACVGILMSAQAQHCGFDFKHQQALAQDPVFAQKVQQLNDDITSMIQSNANALIVNTPNGPVYQIPLVVHVIHTGGAVGSVYNPSDAQLTGMVNYLNQTFSASYPGYPSPNNGGTFIPLQFALAQRDPNCQPTNGIIRVDGSSLAGYSAGGMAHNTSLGASEVDVKSLSRWPNTDYYNIWIVNKIDGTDGLSPGSFVAGFAWFPGAPETVDGTVMLASQASAGKKTLPHEIGHAFALYHTFQGDNGGTTCPPNANCATQGDRVCDTDPHMVSMFNCPENQTNPCTGNLYGTVVRNMMDYSNCADRFTGGQSIRMINALLGQRASLISSLGATPVTGAVTAACIPTSPSLVSSSAGPRNVTISDAFVTHMDVSSSGRTADGGVHIDNTCKHMVDLTAGNVYNFSVRTGPAAENVKVFVDYNNDGVFQAGEEIYANSGTGGNQTHAFQYTVPTVANVPTLVSCLPLRMRVVSDVTSAPAINPCGPISMGQAEDYTVIIRGGGPSTGAVGVSLTQGTNPSCFNSPLTFTAIPGAGVTNPTYEWFVNGNPTGVTANTYSSSTLGDNDVVTVKMHFIGACGFDSSTSLPFIVDRATSVPAAVAIALSGGNNPGCAGQQLTFTATPSNGGTNPSYQWKVNGGNVGTNSATFTAALNDGDIVSVEMTSNSACASPANATSNTIQVSHIQITADVTIAIVDGSNPMCAGELITFEATPTNGGTAPGYQWFVNGQPVAGATGAGFTTTTLAHNDIVTAVLTATDPCVSNASDTSNAIQMTVYPSLSPSISIAITQGDNPGCIDSLVEFTATVTDHGPSPLIEWLVNGTPMSFGPVYSTSTLLSNDQVVARSITTDGACYTTDTANSAPIVMQRFTTPPTPAISFIGNMLESSIADVIWYGPSGPISGTSGYNYQPTEAGYYFAINNNNGCHSVPSNTLLISLLDIATYNLDQVKVYPNPTTGRLIFDWGAAPVNVTLTVYSVSGQGIYFTEVRNESRKELDLSNFANGSYFIMVTDQAGNRGTVRVLLNK